MQTYLYELACHWLTVSAKCQLLLQNTHTKCLTHEPFENKPIIRIRLIN
jgi:hypothetical protein